ncbi:glycerol-3-phosphate acyltransferase [Chloroflexota bacterium]
MWVRVPLPAPERKDMPWLIITLSYLLGAIPTAYIAGRLLKRGDIRQLGDGNMGAQNAFRQLGHKTGIIIFFIDTAKGVLPILIARAASIPQLAIFTVGVASVIGHNWPVFIGFRGGRGESTTIGVLLALITQPLLIVAGPALAVLAIKKNVTLASVFLFIPLPLVCWWLGLSGALVTYSMALPSLVGFTHFLRRRRVSPSGVSSA